MSGGDPAPRMMRLSQSIEHFQQRGLQDALAQATAQFWRKRAADFEAARPRSGEFHGRATREELAARDARCAATALACRRHAELLESAVPDYIAREVADVLAKAA